MAALINKYMDGISAPCKKHYDTALHVAGSAATKASVADGCDVDLLYRFAGGAHCLIKNHCD